MSNMNNTENSMRINKAIARAGICSRRQADIFVQNGQVTINDAPVLTAGAQVHNGDHVNVNGREFTFNAEDTGDFIYLMLNKPVQVVSTVSDPEGRETVISLLPAKYAGKRVYPVGRLDYFSEGLLLLTNDGELTQRLTHPSFHLPKYYEVLVRGDVTDEKINLMQLGMRLSEGQQLAPVKVARIESTPKGVLLGMTLGQGVNRQIRRMCRDLDLTILKLTRTRQGSLALGALPAGQCRELTANELGMLKKAVGL